LTLDEIKWAIAGAKKLKIKHEVGVGWPCCFRISSFLQWITVVPRRNRLRIYIDGPDKYYKLRELRRALPEVVVKVSNGDGHPINIDDLTCPLGSPEHPQSDYQYQGRGRPPWKEGGQGTVGGRLRSAKGYDNGR